jgi:hypothetical protein
VFFVSPCLEEKSERRFFFSWAQNFHFYQSTEELGEKKRNILCVCAYLCMFAIMVFKSWMLTLYGFCKQNFSPSSQSVFIFYISFHSHELYMRIFNIQ